MVLLSVLRFANGIIKLNPIFFLNKWNVVLKLLLSYLAALGLSCITWDLPCSMPGLFCGLLSLVATLMLSSCWAWVQ